MLNNQGFDLWANDYDRTVNISEENNTRLQAIRMY